MAAPRSSPLKSAPTRLELQAPPRLDSSPDADQPVNLPPELDFLADLRSAPGAEAAWSRFAECYTPLLLRVCRRYGADHDDVLDCYMNVCGRLIEDNYRRLLGLRGEWDS